MNTRLASSLVHVMDESARDGDVIRIETRMCEPKKTGRKSSSYEEVENTKLLIPRVVADNDGSGTRLIDYMALRSTQVHQSEPSISCSVCFRLNWPITTAPRFVRFRLRELRQLG